MMGDFLAVMSVLGSFLILLTAVINAIAGHRILRNTGEILRWSILGFIFGMLGWISLIVTNIQADRIGVIFRIDPTKFSALLIASLLLLVIRILLSSMMARLR